jgi:ribonuclease HII
MITVGIDEVGRGCWAGPLVAAAVVLQDEIAGVKDSKKISKNKRTLLSHRIKDNALAYGIGWVSAEEIDIVGLSESVRLAMRRALEQINIMYDRIIIDGNYNFLEELPNTETIIRADDTIPSVSAASIIAKVARDSYMTSMSDIYKDYGFELHVGYGTPLHIERLKIHGISPLHRKSFKPIKLLLQYSA